MLEEKIDIDTLLDDKKKINLDSDSGNIDEGQDSFSLINSILILEMVLFLNSLFSLILKLKLFIFIGIYLSVYIMPILIVLLTICAFYTNTMLMNLKNYIIVWILIIFNFFLILINHYDIIINMF